MASSLCKISAIVAFVCLTPLFPDYQHIVKGDENLCGTPSALHLGPCFDDKPCNNLCKGPEGAVIGFCRGQMCFCLDKCPKQKLGGTPDSNLHDVCDRPSAFFHGACFDANACHNLCVGREDALGGMCPNFKCQCLYSC